MDFVALLSCTEDTTLAALSCAQLRSAEDLYEPRRSGAPLKASLVDGVGQSGRVGTKNGFGFGFGGVSSLKFSLSS